MPRIAWSVLSWLWCPNFVTSLHRWNLCRRWRDPGHDGIYGSSLSSELHETRVWTFPIEDVEVYNKIMTIWPTRRFNWILFAEDGNKRRGIWLPSSWNKICLLTTQPPSFSIVLRRGESQKFAKARGDAPYSSGVAKWKFEEQQIEETSAKIMDLQRDDVAPPGK